MAAQMLQAVDCAVEVGRHHIVGAAAITGMHAGLGRAFDQPVDRPRLGQIIAHPHIAMQEVHRGETRQRELAATTTQIVESDDLPIGMRRLEP